MGTSAITFDNFDDSVVVTSTGAVNVGDPLLSTSGDVIGFAQLSCTGSGSLITYRIRGRCNSVPKSTADAWAIGQLLFWDSVNNVATRTPTAYFIGCAATVQLAADTSGSVILNGPSNGIIGTQIAAASSAVTNTTTATTFSNGSFSIPAGALTVGSTIRVRARCSITGVTGTPNGTLALLLGSTSLVSTGAVAVLANGVGIMQASLVVRTVGASGTLMGSALMGMGVTGTATAAIQAIASGSAVTINTTVANTLNVQFTWSAASASNTAVLDEFDVEIPR